MSNYKLLVLDVDGTLIGHGAYPSPRVTDAIMAAKARGTIVALGTGRASEACYHLFQHLSLDGLHIVFDGAAIVQWPSNDIVFLQALSPIATRRAIELAREYNLFLEIYAHDFYFIEDDGVLAEHQRRKLQLTPLITDLMSLVNRVKVVKCQVLAADAEQKRRADLLTEEMQNHCKVAWSLDPSNGIYFGNLVSRYVSKGGALRELVDYQGVSLEETVVVGDSYNDMGIFTVAGTAVAMGHAPDELKELADVVVSSVDDDGVAEAVERYFLD